MIVIACIKCGGPLRGWWGINFWYSCEKCHFVGWSFPSEAEAVAFHRRLRLDPPEGEDVSETGDWWRKAILFWVGIETGIVNPQRENVYSPIVERLQEEFGDAPAQIIPAFARYIRSDEKGVTSHIPRKPVNTADAPNERLAQTVRESYEAQQRRAEPDYETRLRDQAALAALTGIAGNCDPQLCGMGRGPDQKWTGFAWFVADAFMAARKEAKP